MDVCDGFCKGQEGADRCERKDTDLGNDEPDSGYRRTMCLLLADRHFPVDISEKLSVDRLNFARAYTLRGKITITNIFICTDVSI